MKRVLRALKAAACLLAALVGVLALYNQAALRAEAGEIVPNGRMVDMGGYRAHVYAEGENEAAPTLVFLSGSATVAPVYDFRALYRLLSDEYRIAVVEKAGYGYSDIARVERDVASMVREVRGALAGAGEEGPYLLLPHSMSGLEALYWAQEFPDEIAGIVGLDMSVPGAYDDFDFSRTALMRTVGRLTVRLGLLRIPGIYPLNEGPLSAAEARQQRLLMHRNAVNDVYLAEGDAVYANAQVVKAGGAVSCPILLFASDGGEIGPFWIPEQERFARENHASLTVFDCGHYLHYYRSGEMAAAIKRFVSEILEP